MPPRRQASPCPRALAQAAPCPLLLRCAFGIHGFSQFPPPHPSTSPLQGDCPPMCLLRLPEGPCLGHQGAPTAQITLACCRSFRRIWGPDEQLNVRSTPTPGPGLSSGSRGGNAQVWAVAGHLRAATHQGQPLSSCEPTWLSWPGKGEAILTLAS